MGEAPGIILLVALGVFVLVVSPIMTLVSWMKIRELERRVSELARRGVGTEPGLVATPAPAVPPPPVAAPATPTVVAPPPVSTPTPIAGPSAVTAVVPADTAPPAAAGSAAPPRPPRTGADLEGMIAGRWLNRVGLLAVTVGVALFLKAAIDNDWIGPAGQIAVGLLLGAGLIASTGWFLKRGYHYFADGITGLGAAVLYLSLWAASSYYQLIPPTAAFVAMTAVTAAMVIIALGRNSQRVAALALAGGFVTPALVSTGADAQVALFSYLGVQNAVLLVVAHQREWRLLEIPAFLFTQLYFWIWYDGYYRGPLMTRTALFAALFYAEFAILPVIRSRRHGAFRMEHGVLLLLNVTAFLVALQAMMWPDHRWLLTISTLALAAFHLVVARAVPDDRPLPRLIIGGLALTLVTVAIPMRLSDQWTSIAWAVEAAVLMWVGFRVGIWQVRTASFVLFAIVGLLFMIWPPDLELSLWNARFAVTLATAASAFAALAFARANAAAVADGERPAFGVLAVAANVVLVLGITEEIGMLYLRQPDVSPTEDTLHAQGLAVSVFWTLYASGLVALGVRSRSALLRWQGLALFGVTTIKVFFYDLADLAGIYRILSAIALGVVLLIVSFVYQRKLSAGHREEGA